MNFFADNADELTLVEKMSPSETGLRECQIGAYWATCAHFTASKEPALIVMPTGSGKTAVMIMLSFGLKAKRVLVVEPAVVLRDQTSDRFSTLKDLIEQGALPATLEKPNVHCQKNRITSPSEWAELEEYDVVVATPHTISHEYHKSIVSPPEGLFDLVFFDEAHHIRAVSWKELLEAFSSATCVQLTATPFRLDKKKMLGQIAYYYPLQRAIENGIHQPVKYHRVIPPIPKKRDQRDQALCEMVKKILDEERLESKRSKILIRAGLVKQSKPLIKLYETKGIHVDEVNYKKTMKANKKVLEALKENKLDGVVCVGMLGEGVDIPELKIAVFHDPPKSFPFTIQFIGRVTRPIKSQIGDAHVVVDPEQIAAGKISDELRHLYTYDKEGWRKLIPDMVNEIIGHETESLSLSYQYKGEIINPKEIRPFHTVKMYEVKPRNLDLSKPVDLGENTPIYSLPSIDPKIDPQFRGFITQRITTPAWAPKLNKIEGIIYDLHLYYYHEKTKILFESTTSNTLANKIRARLVKGRAHKLRATELIKAVQSTTLLTYNIFGLANALGPGPTNPTYVTYMGDDVAPAVQPVNHRLFVPGHALAREFKGESRGFSFSQACIWSIKRSKLMEFIEWCERIGDDIYDNKSMTELKVGPFKNFIKPIKLIPAEPIEIIFDPGYLKYFITITRRKNRQSESRIVASPRFVIEDVDLRESFLAEFYPNGEDESFGISLEYDIKKKQWKILDEKMHTASFKLEFEPITYDGTVADSESMKLADALSEKFVPQIYLANGAFIRGGDLYQPKPTLPEVPDECFVKGLVWSSCDIGVEVGEVSDGKSSVQDWLEKWLEKNSAAGSIIFKDHAAGELADFVVVEPIEGDAGTIRFYHCKAHNTIGASIGHLKGVIDQVLRSVSLIKKKDLIDKIIDHEKRRPNSKFIPKGTNAKGRLKKLNARFIPTQWSYEVVIVQPGLDCKAAATTPNTKIILLSCYQWLQAIGAQLKIMGYYVS